MRRPSVGRRDSSASRQQINNNQMEQSNSNTNNLTSTDYQTNPTYVRGYSGRSQMSQINQEEFKQQVEQQQEPLDNYPVFQQKRILDINQSVFERNNSILSLRYSNDDQYLASSQQDGQIKVYNVKKQTITYTLVDQQIPSPCTAVRWCPISQGYQNTLIASYANGISLYWHATSKKVLHRYEDPENSINALDINKEGTKFATGGQDNEIKLYDVGKKSVPQIFEAGDKAPKHTNRIYGIKFDPTDPNLMISGGWDQTILLWDLRTKHSQGFIWGPQIYSDSFDIKDNLLLTGSWREKDQLQLYDLRKLKKLETIQWENYSKDKKQQSLVYCCQFNKNNSNQIVAGSTGTHELRIFEKQNSGKHECVDIFKEGVEKGVYCMDFGKNKQNQQFAYGCADGLLGIAEVV